MTKTFREALEAMEPVAWLSQKLGDAITNTKKEGRKNIIPWDAEPYSIALRTTDQAASTHAESVRELVEAAKHALSWLSGIRHDQLRAALQRHESGSGGERPLPTHHGDQVIDKSILKRLCAQHGLKLVAEQPAQAVDPACAAIKFALKSHCDGGLEFLRCWMHGDFDAIREEWPEAPEAVFIGADPLLERAPSTNAPADSAEKVCEWRHHAGMGWSPGCCNASFLAKGAFCQYCGNAVKIVEAGPADNAKGERK